MKKVFLFFATCCIALGAMAQIQVNSNTYYHKWSF